MIFWGGGESKLEKIDQVTDKLVESSKVENKIEEVTAVDKLVESPDLFEDKINDILEDPINERTYRYLSQNIRDFEKMSDIEKVNAIRRWLAKKLEFVYYSSSNSKIEGAIEQDHNQYSTMESMDIIEGIIGSKDPIYILCAGLNTILMKIYQELDIPVISINFGFRGRFYTHFVTLVEVDKELFLQDAWYNTTWLSNDGEYLSLDKVLNYLEKYEVNKINFSLEFRGDFISYRDEIGVLLEEAKMPSSHYYILYFVFEVRPFNKKVEDYANGDLCRLIKLSKCNDIRVFNTGPCKILKEVVNERTYQYLSQNIKDFETMTDLEKVNAIRRWLAKRLDFVYVNWDREDAIEQSYQQYWVMESVDIIEEIIANKDPIFMYGASLNAILMKIYQDLRIPVVTLNMGFRGIYTYFVTLVEVNRKLFLQDAWCNTTWLNNKNEYISLDEVLDCLENSEAEGINVSPEYRGGYFMGYLDAIEVLLEEAKLPSSQYYLLYYVFKVNPISKKIEDYAKGSLLKLIELSKCVDICIWDHEARNKLSSLMQLSSIEDRLSGGVETKLDESTNLIGTVTNKIEELSIVDK